uniref:Reverse transcriptase Ty1/copia-type domain-containing protein n=1 Tax=Cannabis sativa TaxID=3483 RepID=A0A803NUX1_CANSA
MSQPQGFVDEEHPDYVCKLNKAIYGLKQAPRTWFEQLKQFLLQQGTSHLGLTFKPATQIDLQGYTDADWAGCYDDRKSTSGYFVFLGQNLISWASKKQSVVARSSTESEYRALALATSELVWIESLLTELSINLSHCPILWCDNLGAGSLASNPVYHARTKHIEIDLHFVRDKVIGNKLDVRYVDSTYKIANILTKPLLVQQFVYLRDKLTLSCPSVT